MNLKRKSLLCAIAFIALNFFADNTYAEIPDELTFTFKKFQSNLKVKFTRKPRVLHEGIAHISLHKMSDGSQIKFPSDDNSVVIELKALDSEVIAPKPEIHFNYLDQKGRMASRFFFTSGGRWLIRIKLKDTDLLEETQEKVVTIVNDNTFPKDTTSFPYTGKIAHRYVGILGGTGCRRRWDFVDTHDSLHMNMPYDLCGKYAMVSSRYHKWIDLSIDGDKVEKLQLSPLKGDAVMEAISCSEKKLYKLIHYPECGGDGKVIAICDEKGNSVSQNELSCLGGQLL